MSTVNQKYLKDENGSVISPVVSADSVYGSNGKKLLDFFYPVGCYFETSDTSFDPNKVWGGTWNCDDTVGRVTVAADVSGDGGMALNNVVILKVGETTGEKTHTLTVNEMPSHSHAIATTTENGSAGWALNGNWHSDQSFNCTAAGGGAAHNNVQPSIGVVRWHRTK